MIRLLVILLAALGAPVAGQAPSVTFSPRFAEYRQVTGTAEVSTLQLAAGARRRVFPLSLYVWCEQACTVTVETGGAAASATLSGSVMAIGIQTTPDAQVYRDSNVGAGTAINVVRITAGNGMTIGLTDVFFGAGQNAARNLTVRVAGDNSGVIRRSFLWAEQ